jgi:hypothetical protein
MKKLILKWLRPYEVVNIEQMYFNAELVRATLFCIRCIKSCQTLEQLKTCSSIMHTHVTCRFIGHPLYIKYFTKLLQHYHFRLKLIELMNSTRN